MSQSHPKSTENELKYKGDGLLDFCPRVAKTSGLTCISVRGHVLISTQELYPTQKTSQQINFCSSKLLESSLNPPEIYSKQQEKGANPP